MQTIRFEARKATARRRVKCSAGCGRTLVRTRTFEKTVNPFNKDENGLPKTPARVQADVDREAAEWNPAANCRHCEDA